MMVELEEVWWLRFTAEQFGHDVKEVVINHIFNVVFLALYCLLMALFVLSRRKNKFCML